MPLDWIGQFHSVYIFFSDITYQSRAVLSDILDDATQVINHKCICDIIIPNPSATLHSLFMYCIYDCTLYLSDKQRIIING